MESIKNCLINLFEYIVIKQIKFMNKDYSLLIQFDLCLSRSPNIVFTFKEINEILENITNSNLDKKFCLNFFTKNLIITLSDSYSKTYYYNLEKIGRYKPYPNYKKMVELIKGDGYAEHILTSSRETAIDINFLNLSLNDTD